MRWWDMARMRVRSLARRERVETELTRELRFHVERETEENIARGWRRMTRAWPRCAGSAASPRCRRSAARCDASNTSRISGKTCDTRYEAWRNRRDSPP